MFHPLSLFIGLRYTRARRRTHFISFISATSMIGIALGVTALITVLSVMNGFEKELRERILGMTSHASIQGYDGGLRDWPALLDEISKDPRVLGAAPYIQKEGMLTLGQQVNGSIIQGIFPEHEPRVSEVGSKMLFGELNDLRAGEYNIVLGKDLARQLGVLSGDKVTLIAPQANVTPAGVLPRLRRFTVTGVFEVGMYEYDSALALIHAQDAAKLFGFEDAVSGIRLRVADIFEAPFIAQDLAQKLSGSFLVSDWTRQHQNFFRALQIEKRMMFIILSLIIAVAAFNIVSTMVMVVRDKTSEIAILRTLGASPRTIRNIFMVQGTVIGVVGTVMGTLGGVTLALNVDVIVPAIERMFSIQFLPADVYYISEFPSDLHWSDVFWISSLSFVMSLAATRYPAWRAARTQPAEALRYE